MRTASFTRLAAGFFVTAAVAMSASAGFAGVDADKVQIRIYRFAVSDDPYCTNPTVVFESSNPAWQDMEAGPKIEEGAIPDGYYPCVMIEMSDLIRFVPARDDGGECVHGREFIHDICRDGGETVLLNGSTVKCSTNSDDRVVLYLSTHSLASSKAPRPKECLSDDDPCNSFKPTSADFPNRGIWLRTELYVSGGPKRKFHVDTRGTVETTTSENEQRKCTFEPPVFTFR